MKTCIVGNAESEQSGWHRREAGSEREDPGRVHDADARREGAGSGQPAAAERAGRPHYAPEAVPPQPAVVGGTHLRRQGGGLRGQVACVSGFLSSLVIYNIFDCRF